MSGEVAAKRSIAGQIDERVKTKMCLLCDTKAERRGLCMRHYQLFLRRQRERGDSQRQVEFEQSCIREGKILAVHQMRKIKTENPFNV